MAGAFTLSASKEVPPEASKQMEPETLGFGAEQPPGGGAEQGVRLSRTPSRAGVEWGQGAREGMALWKSSPTHTDRTTGPTGQLCKAAIWPHFIDKATEAQESTMLAQGQKLSGGRTG